MTEKRKKTSRTKLNKLSKRFMIFLFKKMKQKFKTVVTLIKKS